MFNVGDTVYSVLSGRGVVTDIKHSTYSIQVIFEDNSQGSDSYTVGGLRFVTSKHPELYHYPVKVYRTKEVEYKVLYRSCDNEYKISGGYYLSKQEFERAYSLDFIQLIQESKRKRT